MAESHDAGEPGPFRTRHDRRVATTSEEYSVPDFYRNLDDDVPPISQSLPQHASPFPPDHARCHSGTRRTSAVSQPDYDVPDAYANLDEAADVSPVQNPYEEPTSRFRSLEHVRSENQQVAQEQRLQQQEKPAPALKRDVPRLATQLYTVSYLILFSILGTLARLGLQALTTYPGTPILFPSIWPNFAGSLIMGYLSEDRMIFSEAGESPRTLTTTDEETPSPGARAKQSQAATTTAHKKTIPLYIGLVTGFCGSLTSFSAFMRDTFLALTNDLPPSPNPPTSDTGRERNGGHSFVALIAIPIITLSLSLSALYLGAHLAIALTPRTPAIPRSAHTFLDKLAVLLGWGSWLGAVLLSIFPPADHADWREKVTFALVFAPLGCLVRFFVSLRLNGRVTSFPLGTFVVNVAGTGVLALAWDLAHSGLAGSSSSRYGGGVVGCQVLKGVQDGFCGCLTTVSTWVGELAALRRRHAYVYGGASVLGGFAVVVAVMGGLRWSGAYEWGACG